MWAENARSSPAAIRPRQKSRRRPRSVFAYFDRSTPNPWEIFRRTNDADLQKKTTTPDGASITLWKWLR